MASNGSAVAGRAEAAGAVPRSGARTKCSLHRVRLRCRTVPGRTAPCLRKAQQLLTEAGVPIKDGKRVLPNGEVFSDRVPAGRAFVPAAPRALHQEPGHARHRSERASRRCRAVQARQGRFRLRHDDPAFQHVGDAGRRDARLFFSSQVAATKGSYNLAGVASPVIDALDREDHGGADNREGF